MNSLCAFWQWNRRVSPRTFTPGRKSSGKLPVNVRALQALRGKPISFLARRRAAAAKRNATNKLMAKVSAMQSIRKAVTAVLAP